jgi:hypothetical protein
MSSDVFSFLLVLTLSILSKASYDLIDFWQPELQMVTTNYDVVNFDWT